MFVASPPLRVHARIVGSGHRHSGFIGRCKLPDSPPVMSQSMPVRSRPLSRPSSGSAEMNLTAAGTSLGRRRGHPDGCQLIRQRCHWLQRSLAVHEGLPLRLLLGLTRQSLPYRLSAPTSSADDLVRGGRHACRASDWLKNQEQARGVHPCGHTEVAVAQRGRYKIAVSEFWPHASWPALRALASHARARLSKPAPRLAGARLPLSLPRGKRHQGRRR